MNSRYRTAMRMLLPTLALLAMGSQAAASTLNQNVSWTIDRAGSTTKYRVVAYGDSIYAGYNGSTTNAAKFSAPTVEAEYLAAQWNTDRACGAPNPALLHPIFTPIRSLQSARTCRLRPPAW